MEQIYHPYWLWEDYKEGFYRNYTRKELLENQQKVIDFFSNSEEVEYYMNKVITDFKYSCEHNLTNKSMNRIAWLGQSASLLQNGSPSELTMFCWKFIPEEHQNKANEIANKIINNYVENILK